MSFADSVRTCFSKYVTFSGRARRSEFWWFYLFTVICFIVVAIIDAAIGNSILEFVLLLALILPSLAASMRRLHDTGRSGWWVLIGLVPFVGAIILIVFECGDSQPGTNQYGPSPKELGGPNPAGYPAPQGY
jgi:uncharacterized membrane protein YhaH (DUF805 family)